jgi:hypothetical protein
MPPQPTSFVCQQRQGGQRRHRWQRPWKQVAGLADDNLVERGAKGRDWEHGLERARSMNSFERVVLMSNPVSQCQRQLKCIC